MTTPPARFFEIMDNFAKVLHEEGWAFSVVIYCITPTQHGTSFYSNIKEDEPEFKDALEQCQAKVECELQQRLPL